MHKVYTQIRLSSVAIPPLADFTLTENVGLISGASDLRRTVNGEPVNVARSPFKKYFVNISASGAWSAGLHGLGIGDYCEVIPSDHLALSVPGGALSAQLPRACVDVHGITPDGRRIAPTAQPADPQPLHAARTPARIVALRAKPTVTFAEAVMLIRFRPVLACVVAEWSTDSTEQDATTSWAVRLEEI